MNIKYFEVKQMGRVDIYPTDEKVGEAVKLLVGKFSPVITQNMKEGLEMLGHTFEKVERQ